MKTQGPIISCLVDVILLVFLIPAFPSTALSGENIGMPGYPFIHNFTPKEYRGHPQNWSIVQDNRGIMYFGNNEAGLLEYDGSRWRRIKVGDNSAIRSLAMDAQGTVYIGSYCNFGFLKTGSKGQRYFVSLLDKLKKGDRIFDYVWNIHITSHGLYFNAQGQMIRFHNNKMELYPMNAILRSFAVYGRVLVPQRGGGILVFEKGKPGVQYGAEDKGRIHRSTFRSTTILNSKFKSAEFGTVLIAPYNDAEQTILIATEEKGFYLYDLAGIKCQVNYSPAPNELCRPRFAMKPVVQFSLLIIRTAVRLWKALLFRAFSVIFSG